ncbi:MAG: hypothetical protein ACFFFH_09055 [Candidatus Thorarchaeota archaeon]
MERFFEKIQSFSCYRQFSPYRGDIEGNNRNRVVEGLKLRGVSIFRLKPFDPRLKYIQKQYNGVVHSVLDFDKITSNGSTSYFHTRKICFKPVDITLEPNRYDLA